MVLGCVGFVVVVVVAGLVVGPLLLLLLSRAINVGRKRENLTRAVVRDKKKKKN